MTFGRRSVYIDDKMSSADVPEEGLPKAPEAGAYLPIRVLTATALTAFFAPPLVGVSGRSGDLFILSREPTDSQRITIWDIPKQILSGSTRCSIWR